MGTYGRKLTRLDQALDVIAHRGPDGTGVKHLSDTTFGHTRLAIIDVDGGHQPLSDPRDQRWMVANGEIYNYPTLREQHSDYDFKTDSDSEIILALYDRYGPDAASHLTGMFAFALTDEDDIYMARDPLGIKPLYYGWEDDTLFFGSEIKAMQEMVSDIREFPPGYYYTTKTGFVQFYNVAGVGMNAMSRHAAPPDVEAIYNGMDEAVRRRLMSDVPLGVFLSGGLDSSIIASLVARYNPNVHTFAVGVAGGDDIPRARAVAEFLGTQHHELIYTIDDMVQILPEVIYHLESFTPSLVRSAIPNFFLAKLASQYVTVVLTGEGADELYAGYHYLKGFDSDEGLHRELIDLTSNLYNLNLQRCDRMTMAHGLEGRVPFLDTDFIDLSFSIPVDQKIYGQDATEKYILRKAFEESVPSDVVWRVKEQFSHGAGSANVFEQMADREISDAEFLRDTDTIWLETGYRIAHKEELLYYREFRKHFPNPATTRLVNHWRGGLSR